MINQTFIDNALQRSHPVMVSVVAKNVRTSAHEHGYISRYYNPRIKYLEKGHLNKSLRGLKLDDNTLDFFVNWIRTEAQNAYERGVFVVTDRVLLGLNYSFDSPEALLAVLRNKESVYFTSTLWYTDDTYKSGLESERWNHDIVNAISGLTLRYCRCAFTHGMQDACKMLVDNNE